MIALLIPIVARLGVPARVQRVAAWLLVAAILAAVAVAIGIWWRSTVQREREDAVYADRLDASLAAANRAMEATVAADLNAVVQTEADRTNEKELQREIDSAAPSNGAVGPVTGSLLERLRQQQAAGRR